MANGTMFEQSTRRDSGARDELAGNLYGRRKNGTNRRAAR
jgi:hypothetical protein